MKLADILTESLLVEAKKKKKKKTPKRKVGNMYSGFRTVVGGGWGLYGAYSPGDNSGDGGGDGGGGE